MSDILRQVKEGKLEVCQAEDIILTAKKATPEEPLEAFANLDHGRAMRTGFPEAVFAAGKTPQQVAAILDDMAKHVNLSLQQSRRNAAGTAILATRYDSLYTNKMIAQSCSPLFSMLTLCFTAG